MLPTSYLFICNTVYVWDSVIAKTAHKMFLIRIAYVCGKQTRCFKRFATFVPELIDDSITRDYFIGLCNKRTCYEVSWDLFGYRE